MIPQCQLIIFSQEIHTLIIEVAHKEFIILIFLSSKHTQLSSTVALRSLLSIHELNFSNVFPSEILTFVIFSREEKKFAFTCCKTFPLLVDLMLKISFRVFFLSLFSVFWKTTRQIFWDYVQSSHILLAVLWIFQLQLRASQRKLLCCCCELKENLSSEFTRLVSTHRLSYRSHWQTNDKRRTCGMWYLCTDYMTIFFVL